MGREQRLHLAAEERGVFLGVFALAFGPSPGGRSYPVRANDEGEPRATAREAIELCRMAEEQAGARA
jgi:hypothetical protein